MTIHVENPTRQRIMAVRLTEDERRALRCKAEAAGLTLSDYTRQALATYGAIREVARSYGKQH